MALDLLCREQKGERGDERGGARIRPTVAAARGPSGVALATYLYARGDGSWLIYAALFFVPDFSFAGYLAGPRIGAVIYNVAHSYIGPAMLAATLLNTGQAVTVPLVWAAHIGFDRVMGYGLKYPSSFGDTHLGRIGRR